MSEYIYKLKTMNRKSKLIVLLVFLECIFSFLTYKAFQSGIEHHNNEINKNNFNVKYEVDGEYVDWTGSAFPSSDTYELDLDKTSCVNKADETINNAISYANSKVTVSTNQTLYCTLYFYNAIKGYTVYHYQENIDVAEGAAQNTTNYTLIDTDNLTGRVGTSVTPEVKTYTGFTAPSKITVTILRDGSAEVNYYYTRNQYTLTANANNGSIPATSGWSGTGGTATKTLDYAAVYSTLPSPTRSGYTFAGWFTAADGGTEVSSTTTMGAANTTIYAHWTEAYAINFNYTGQFVTSSADVDKVRTGAISPKTGSFSITDKNWMVYFLTSGTLTISSLSTNIDIWGIGGGGSGGIWTGGSGPFVVMGGGGSGYTSMVSNISLSKNTNYSITIGAGGTSGGNGTASNFGSILTANGGNGGGSVWWSSRSSYQGSGGAGGSGGGGGSGAYGNPSAGGSNGSNGGGSNGGAGSGSSTYEFGDSNLTLRGGGGGGGKYYYNSEGPAAQGGAGGGGNGASSTGWEGEGSSHPVIYPTNGLANTGGGGGGVAGFSGAGSGGSGIVIIRNAR